MNRLGTFLAFGLCEYQFTHYGFFGRATHVFHPLPHRIGQVPFFVLFAAFYYTTKQAVAKYLSVMSDRFFEAILMNQPSD